MADSTSVFELSTTEGRAKIFSSDPAASVDAPEPSDALGRFVYNYFVPNEKSEYSGGTGFTARTFAPITSDDFNGRKSRYTEVRFKKPQVEFEASTTSDISAYLDGNTLLDLAQRGFVHTEDSVTSTKYQRIQLTATGLNLRAVSALSGSSSYVMPDGGSSTLSNPELSRNVAQSIAGVRGSLPSDLSTAVTAASSDEEIRDTIVKYINGSGQPLQKITYYNGTDRTTREVAADILTDRQETLGISNLVFDSVIRASSCNINHLLNAELSAYRASSADVQSAARTEYSALGVNPDAFEISVTPFYTDTRRTSSYRSVLVGYIVEKIEVGASGEIISHPTLVLEGASVTNFQDLLVNYGAMYKYRVRAVFMRETPAILESSGTSGRAKFLVASSGESAEVFVTCAEDVPPPEPADFRVTYDYENEAMRLSWSLPVNPQIDIKYFQVFRRDSLEKPFRLQSVIDFDNSGIKEPPRESYPAKIVRQVSMPQCFYNDPVDKEREYIYTLCSVDAHGISSGYSMQISAVFRRSRNAIQTRIVSRAGAPKTYPNLYINEDAFADVVNVSRASRLTTFLDAELLSVSLPGGARENLVENATFTVSIINEDNCLADSVKIRTSKYAPVSAYLSASIVGVPEEVLAAPAVDTSTAAVDFTSDSFR